MKVLVTGGGGLLLLYCPVARQREVRRALSRWWEIPIYLERDGTKAIFNYRRSVT